MFLEDYNYELPEHLIAQHPLKDRSSSRLLCFTQKNIDHAYFKDLADHLRPEDLLVFNDTRVIPARIYATKETGGKVEVFIEEIISKDHARASLSNSKKLKNGDLLSIYKNIEAKIVDHREGFFELKFSTDLDYCLEHFGHTPLPPYIKRQALDDDKFRYQTIYAQHDGAVAAPTAGLHFDDQTMVSIAKKGVNKGFLTLHVGAGTFMPIRSKVIENHTMHQEYVHVTETLCDLIAKTKLKGGRVIAVGTTCVIALETVARQGRLSPYKGYTDLFIYPGYQFKVVDAMITNFHQPKSSLLVLVSAFIGIDNLKEIYKKAIEKEYRFFSYGDATFIEKS
jgi:S-adenosylmethionine:tRNA ribosyltransferase-isomerase